MLKLSDLAQRADFRVGALSISPARRRVQGPSGEVHLEPLIMQVFLLLLDARGKVVTRTELFDQCWGGVMVGDDSLNRTIAGVRRIAAETAPGLFGIETIPRTGYRMTGEIVALEAEGEPDVARGSTESHGFSRRLLLGSGVAASTAAAAGLWWLGRDPSDPQVVAALESGRRVLREAWPGSSGQAVKYFRRGVTLDPENAEAWGLLALAYRNVAEEAPPAQTTAAVQDCESAAKRALKLDPREANALVALATVRPEFGNWIETEDGLRNALKNSPDNVAALSYLVLLLQSVGRARESWALNERAASLEPLSPVHQYRKALKQWIFGRVPEADLTIDGALQLWPRHPAVWNARMYIFAFTGRPEAAAGFLEDVATRPSTFKLASADLWRVSLRALSSRSAADIAAAEKANIEASPRSPGYSVRAIMVLSHLNALDAAFAVADGFLLRRGPLIGTLWTGSGQMPVNDHYWRRTMNLFTPATAAMRRDRRFQSLCDGIGLSRYWREKGVTADAMFHTA